MTARRLLVCNTFTQILIILKETLFAAEWLYVNTCHKETRRLVLETVTAWATFISDGDLISGAQKEIGQKPYRFFSREFVATHEEEIRSCSVNELLLPALCKEIAAELNQEFLRTRYGGLYNTTADCKEIYFHISSIGFEWKDIVCRFLTETKLPLEMIHIIHDEESTGALDAVYLALPPEDFFASQIELKAPAFYDKGRQPLIQIESVAMHVPLLIKKETPKIVPDQYSPPMNRRTIFLSAFICFKSIICYLI